MKMHRILIIEDEKIVAREIKDYLMPEFHADVAHNLTESLFFIKNFNYAVIITDLNLGGRETKGGKTVIAEIKKKSLTNIIVYSAYSADALKENKAYIFKHVLKEKLSEDLEVLKNIALQGLKKYEEDIRTQYNNYFNSSIEEGTHFQASNLIPGGSELKLQEREESVDLAQYSPDKKKIILRKIAIKNPEDALDTILNQPDLPTECIEMASLCKARFIDLKRIDTSGKINTTESIHEKNKLISSVFDIINML